jgi:predicted DCC family thiol-disulfide oxidoreductase YuxK
VTDGSDHSIVYFDGWCGLCNRFVNFLLEHDRKRRIRFATIQGETAGRNLPATYRRTPTTIVLEHQGRRFERSTAALMSLQLLGGAWRLAGVLRLIPRPLRDLVYDWIARKRYSWFGKRGTCRLPTPAERERFLP